MHPANLEIILKVFSQCLEGVNTGDDLFQVAKIRNPDM